MSVVEIVAAVAIAALALAVLKWRPRSRLGDESEDRHWWGGGGRF